MCLALRATALPNPKPAPLRHWRRHLAHLRRPSSDSPCKYCITHLQLPTGRDSALGADCCKYLANAVRGRLYPTQIVSLRRLVIVGGIESRRSTTLLRLPVERARFRFPRPFCSLYDRQPLEASVELPLSANLVSGVGLRCRIICGPALLLPGRATSLQIDR
jgi:hypothetical protein